MSPSQQVVAFDVGVRNFAYCILCVDGDGARRIVAVEVEDLGCRKGNAQAAIDAVIEVLDHIAFQQLDPGVPTVVLIECQMTAFMKAIQTAINVFFKVVSRYHGMEVTTRYLSARHKLALMERFDDYTPPEHGGAAAGRGAKRAKYQQNKTDAVGFAMWLLEHKEHAPEALEKIRGMKKKDDACDAVLMALYHVLTG